MSTLFPFETEAARGDPIPDDLDAIDIAAYTALRDIYASYRKGFISADTGKVDKQTVYVGWCKAKKRADFDRKLSTRSAEIFRDAQGCITAFQKNPSIDTANQLVDVLDGKLRGVEC